MLSYLVLLLPLFASMTQTRPIDRAAFMQGCWERRATTRIIEEQWMRPRGGSMLGMSRTVRGDSLIEYEFLRLFERGENLVYAAQPSGQRPAEFTAVASEAGALVFEDPAHDFPQRISYRAVGDSLFARIEGHLNGRERSMDFRYARVPCA
jgi:hypothetical protein